MPTTPLQFILAGIEKCLLWGGIGLLAYLVSSPQRRDRWLNTNLLAVWPISLGEAILYVLLILIAGTVCQMGLQAGLGRFIQPSRDSAGWGVFVYGTGFHVGGLLGWWFFRHLRKTLYEDYGANPPPPPSRSTLSWAHCFLYAGATLMILMPVLGTLSYGWTSLLRHLGLPDDPQDLLAVFKGTQSSLVVAGMLLVACVFAPLNEEFLFRAGIYRYCRQRLGRQWGLIISGTLFGVMHGNFAGFLPLAVLGAVLALAYEATGSIRVVIITHGLFNLNTILVLLSGLPTT